MRKLIKFSFLAFAILIGTSSCEKIPIDLFQKGTFKGYVEMKDYNCPDCHIWFCGTPYIHNNMDTTTNDTNYTLGQSNTTIAPRCYSWPYQTEVVVTKKSETYDKSKVVTKVKTDVYGYFETKLKNGEYSFFVPGPYGNYIPYGNCWGGANCFPNDFVISNGNCVTENITVCGYSIALTQ